MTVCSHKFVKFTVKKPNCQKHSECVFASGKNAMYPLKIYTYLNSCQHRTAWCRRATLGRSRSSWEPAGTSVLSVPAPRCPLCVLRFLCKRRMIHWFQNMGSGALSGRILLIRIIENSKIDAYFLKERLG